MLASNSFAFVEYEDRRDSDDAYHEMHNKQIGRDDMLKIEVSWQCGCRFRVLADNLGSGLAPLPRRLGASTLGAIVTAVFVGRPRVVAAGLRLLAAAACATTRLARMIAVTAIGTWTASGTTPVSDATVTARGAAARILGTFRHPWTRRTIGQYAARLTPWPDSDRDRDMKDVDRDDRDRRESRENGANGDDRKRMDSTTPLFDFDVTLTFSIRSPRQSSARGS